MSRVTSNPPGCFFLAFFLMGLGGTAVFGYAMIWPPLQANLFYSATSCIVLDKRLAVQDGDSDSSRPEIHIEYRVEGVPHRTWTYDAAGVYTNTHAANRRTLDRFEVGQRYPCWFDAGKPGRAVLTRGFTWWCLMVLIPVVFMVLGAGGLRSKRAPESRPLVAPLPPKTLWPVVGCIGGFFVTGAVAFALLLRFAGIDTPTWLLSLMMFGPFVVFLFVFSLAIKKYHVTRLQHAALSPERVAAPIRHDDMDEATIPTLAAFPGPGRTLRFRLSSSSSPGCSLVTAVGVATFWNGIVSVFLTRMLEGHVQGKPDWTLTFFLIPFVLVGLGLLVWVAVALLKVVGSLLVGRMHVEVSTYALEPGRVTEFAVAPSGLCRLRRVRLALVCTESATYTAGTSTSTAHHVVSDAEILVCDAMPEDGLRGMLATPPDGMHSFTAGHNQITWTLQIEGRVGVLSYRSDYPILLVPASESSPA